MPDLLPQDLTHLLPTALGVAGFLIYAGADIALCLRRLTSEGLLFYVLNGIAACLIGVSLLYTFNLGAFLTELFCLATSCVAIVLRLRDKSRRSPKPPQNPRSMSGARPMPSRGRNLGGGLFPDRIA